MTKAEIITEEPEMKVTGEVGMPFGVKPYITKQISAFFFYIRDSVHRNSRLKKSNEMQLYADIYLPLNCSTCFGRPSRPPSGVHKTVVAASGTDRTVKYKLK